MRRASELEAVRGLLAQGLTDSEIARRTGIPRSTVRGWRTGRQRVADGPPAWGPEGVPPHSYAYLLGLYLGDGHIVGHRREVYKLSIYLDRRYTQIILGCSDAMRDVMPQNRVRSVDRPGSVAVYSYSKQWPRVFPQHGPGKKHERPIVLTDWQTDIVDAEPQAFIRGLIHSDGSRFTNRVTMRGRTYEYPRYSFTNVSDDIRALFTRSCDQLGIAWRRMNAHNIPVARREAVVALDEFVGPKR